MNETTQADDPVGGHTTMGDGRHIPLRQSEAATMPAPDTTQTNIRKTSLFGDLPDDPSPLPRGEAGLLASLPIYPDTVALDDWDEASARRLEKRGLIKVHREKSDPVSHRPTWYAGRLP